MPDDARYGTWCTAAEALALQHKPKMLVAMVAHSPRFGGKVKSFDAGAAKKVPGVVDVEVGQIEPVRAQVVDAAPAERPAPAAP